MVIKELSSWIQTIEGALFLSSRIVIIFFIMWLLSKYRRGGVFGVLRDLC